MQNKKKQKNEQIVNRKNIISHLPSNPEVGLEGGSFPGDFGGLFNPT